MFSYSLETSNDVIDFLKNNGLLSLTQEKKLKSLTKEHKLNPLDVMLKFYPENEEQIPVVLQKIHGLSDSHYTPEPGDKLSRLASFIFVEKEDGDHKVISYDTQFVTEYFNYVIPQTLIVSVSSYAKLFNEELPQTSQESIQMLGILTERIKVKRMTEKDQAVDEEAHDEDAVKQLDTIMRIALQNEVSDIHMEIDTDISGLRFYRVRQRRDGVLSEMLSSNNLDVYAGMLTQIKLRAGLKLDETRLPQDGRMNYSLFGTMHSFRVSTKPVVVIDMKQGGEVQMEKIVIRKMPDVSGLNLESLNNSEYNVQLLREASNLAHGFNVITGPTGSGKTTLLYALLGDIDANIKNISTIEDPVEAELKGVNQTQVLPEIGLDFARVLRAELRQDPDIIMVGEMRDRETAEIAAEASLTGHLVFSTLHTKDAVSSVTRLINMGVPPFIVASSLSYCVAQRLVRKLCNHCKIPHNGTEHVFNEALKKIQNKKVQNFFTYTLKNMQCFKAAPSGCEHCLNSGYMGRTAILEVFKMSVEAEKIILEKNANESELQRIAEQNGMMTLEQDGLIKCMHGITSLDELAAVLVSD